MTFYPYPRLASIVRQYYRLVLFCLVLPVLFVANKASAQDCDGIVCTANEVRIISAYISGPGNTAIDCGIANPFNNAELHLIVKSNTQRKGISFSGVLQMKGGSSYPLGTCFKGITLNNGSNNNLVYNLGGTLSGVGCDAGFKLANVFISWGTGNTDFCTGTSPQCPATPSKCRSIPGEEFPVPVKLDVDFTFTPGICAQEENSMTVAFEPVITASGLTAPFSYEWDFGDGSPTVTGLVNSLDDVPGVSHTFTTAGTQTVTLTIEDGKTVKVVKTAFHTFEVAPCCDIAAPQLTAGPFCSAENKTIGDLPQDDGNGGAYHYYDGADPNSSFELPASTVITNGTTYYVSVIKGDCESPRATLTIVINQTPEAPTVSAGPFCSAEGKKVSDLPQGGGSYKYYDAATGGAIVQGETVIQIGKNYYYVSTTSADGCESARSKVTVVVNPTPPCTISSTGSPTKVAVAASVVFNAPASNIPTVNYENYWTLSSNTSGASFVGASGAAQSSVTVTTTTVGSYTVNLKVKNTVTGCVSGTCSYTITVSPAGPYYTLTQGFYGNTGGVVCTPGGSKTTAGVIEASILNMPGKQLILGSGLKSFTMGTLNTGASSTEISNLIKYLPAGKTPAVLGGAYNITTALPPLSSNKIANNMLGQCITLKLNLSIPGNTLGSFVLQVGYLTTQRVAGTCPSSTLLACTADATSIRSLQITTNPALMNLLKGNTVDYLMNMASNALGGGALQAGITIADISNAVDVINNAFDGGRVSLGYFSTMQSCSTLPTITVARPALAGPVQEQVVSKLSVTAYPNPYNDAVSFQFVSPRSGKALLEVYDMTGRKINVLFSGNVQAGMPNSIKYKVPQSARFAFVYKLTVEGETVFGRMVPGKN